MASAAGSGIKTTGVNIAKRANVSQGYNVNVLNGIYVAEVINDSDAQRNGRITVTIPELGPTAERIILLSTPFGGSTRISDSSDNVEDYGDTSSSVNGAPKTYGMWPQPPSPGSNVLVAFTGSMEQGFLIGFLPPRDRNATMGGNASGDAYDGVDDDKDVTYLSPTAEKNPNDTENPDTRPSNPEAYNNLVKSGLANDYVRGHSESSARRESPSNVFGITTKAGHTLSLDDGNAQGGSDNIRIKTRGGAQILLDDSNGFIFITNKGGSGWIEMDSEGQVDIYSQAGVSIATDGDYNVHAKGSINMQAEQGVNIKSSGSEGVKIESSVGSIDVYSALNLNSNADGNINATASQNVYMQGSRIDMNGPTPKTADKAAVQAQTQNSNVTQSINSRVPEHHPWKGVTGVQESFETGKGNTG